MKLIAPIFALALTIPAFAQQIPAVAESAQQQQQTLGEQMRAVLDTSPVSQRTFVGVQVISANSGETLFEQFPAHLFTPASNMKLYSSACALDTWGPKHRFTTTLAATGPVVDGLLQGDLLLIGGGDPVLKSEDLREMVTRLREEAGVRGIEGQLVIDDTLYDDQLKGPGWMWDDEPDYYNMSVNALMVDYNVLTVDVRQENGRTVARFDPPSEWPPISITGTGTDITVTREPFQETVKVIAEPSDEPFSPETRRLTMHDPSRWVGAMFLKMLDEAQIQVGLNYTNPDLSIPPQDAPLIQRGPVIRIADQPTTGHLLLVHQSPPMSEILALFNKPSENAIGEVLLHNLAIHAGERPATWSAGASVINDWLANEAGLSPGGFRLVDGSGLSRYNLITPQGTVDLLEHMWKHPHRQVYIDSLPIIGVDGTTSNRGQQTPARDRVFAKTGTMSGVSCLSGYVHAENGEWLIFSILTNGYIGSSAPSRRLQDQLCEVMAGWDGEGR